jgi:hypothetical protein
MDFTYGVAHAPSESLIPHHSWPCNDSFSFYTFTATIVEHYPCTLLVYGAWWTNLETELPEWHLNMLTGL